MSQHVTQHRPVLLARPRIRQVISGWARGSLAFAVVAGLVALSGCSSPPAYCSDRTNLQNSVKALPSVTSSSGLSGLKSQLTKVENDAAALVSSAKSDFPSQTSAITSSVNALKSAVQGLPPNPSAAQILAVATDVSAVKNAVKSFSNATQSKCS